MTETLLNNARITDHANWNEFVEKVLAATRGHCSALTVKPDVPDNAPNDEKRTRQEEVRFVDQFHSDMNGTARRVAHHLVGEFIDVDVDTILASSDATIKQRVNPAIDSIIAANAIEVSGV